MLIDRERNQKEYIRIFNELIIPNYPNAKILLEWILGTDFFEAPASMLHHLNVEGGLCQHSLNVYNRLLKEIEVEYDNDFDKLDTDEAMVAICGLCHDLCKTNTYVKDFKNVKVYKANGTKKDNNGKFDWESQEYYKRDEQFIFGHGVKSVFIVQQFLGNLCLPEASAIRYHQGGMENVGTNFLENGITQVYNDFPLALLLHLADMKATYIDERN